VVDPGSPYPDQQAALDAVLADEARAGRPLAVVALTHHHADHVGGARHLAERWGVPLAAHPATAARLGARHPITRTIAADEVIELGEVAVIARFTPGHADGHLCFATPAATIAGDLVAGVGTILIDPEEGDMAHYLASLEALAATAPGMLLPAHGPPISDGVGKLRGYVAHRLAREAKIVAALARYGAATLAELVADAYADTPRPLWPLAARSLLAHLIKLVAEDRAAVVDDGRWAARGGA
jgi:glyoxylase-like metal-dependent hydrolase (beta-lactamase superfamily II)